MIIFILAFIMARTITIARLQVKTRPFYRSISKKILFSVRLWTKRISVAQQLISNLKPIERSFFARDTVEVAPDLLGVYIVRKLDNKILVGMIVETEAYRAHDDPACHAYKGLTERTSLLFGEVGHAYIYFIYGVHYCLNVVAHLPSRAGGVLIRAVEPLQGIEYMERQRHMHKVRSLTNGPGKITQAFSITADLKGTDLTQRGPLFLARGEFINSAEIDATPRVGISKACEYPWRFIVKNNPFVSR